jgi:hypothetical protein
MQNSSRLERRRAKIGPAMIAYEVAGFCPPVVLVDPAALPLDTHLLTHALSLHSALKIL